MDETGVEVISKLLEIPGCTEVFHVETFKCCRKWDQGCMKEVTVNVWDAGPHTQLDGRYICMASDEHGNGAIGSPSESIEGAVKSVDWKTLDTAAPPSSGSLDSRQFRLKESAGRR